jgi:hypothetical protein
MDLKNKQLIKEFAERFISMLPEQLGIDESISGCEVTNMDPYGAGIVPRYIQVRLGGQGANSMTFQPVYWRGSPVIAVGDDVVVDHYRDGDRYEVSTVGGSSGAITPADLFQRVWVYDTSLEMILQYDTITGALGYVALAAEDYILIGPGVYDECITDPVGFPICEIVSGTVTLAPTACQTAVTLIDGSVLKIHKIEFTQNHNGTLYGIRYAGAGEAEAWCDIKITNTNVAGGLIQGVNLNGTGTLRHHGEIWTSSDRSTYSMRLTAAGTLLHWGRVEAYAVNSAYCIRVDAGGVVKHYGDSYMEGTEWAYLVRARVGSDNAQIWAVGNSEIIATNNLAYGVLVDNTGIDNVKVWVIGVLRLTEMGAALEIDANGSGSIIRMHGDIHATTSYNGVGVYVPELGTIYVRGDMFITSTNAVDTNAVNARAGGDIIYNGRIVLNAVNAAIAYGVGADGAGSSIIFHGDLEVTAGPIAGVARGIWASNNADVFWHDGYVETQASVMEDLNQAGGAAVIVSCCEYEHSRVVGTLTLSEGDKANNSGGQALITGGGTIALGGFTLTVPANITAVGGGGAGAVGRVAFWTGANILSSDAGLYWDNVLKRFGVGTTGPSRATHVELSDAVTAAITYGKRLTHITSGVAAALFGAGDEHELEDAGGAKRVASEVVTLWATPAAVGGIPLRRWSAYYGGSIGPGYIGVVSVGSVSNVAKTIIPNGAGDVLHGGRFMYCIYLSPTGLFLSGTIEATAGGGAVDLYNVGANQFTLTVAANGSVTVVRVAGAEVADISILACWL